MFTMMGNYGNQAGQAITNTTLTDATDFLIPFPGFDITVPFAMYVPLEVTNVLGGVKLDFDLGTTTTETIVASATIAGVAKAGFDGLTGESFSTIPTLLNGTCVLTIRGVIEFKQNGHNAQLRLAQVTNLGDINILAGGYVEFGLVV